MLLGDLSTRPCLSHELSCVGLLAIFIDALLSHCWLRSAPRKEPGIDVVGKWLAIAMHGKLHIPA